ncbi:slit homolog 1 protein-like [Toxorhynchites rutilus septentrionalis]|uniref:slit homolog 1 protein-like n=1 Tax=Toxorhynchites rutilus septentrionalis TaxID=329112 RepID=UPI002479BFD3|nr:slit homolog 1 protein-like [Toxorhynchites rutilus septentrionalis]
MPHILICGTIVVASMVLLLDASVSNVETVDICSLCRCLEDAEDGDTMIVECVGKSPSHQQHASQHYLDLHHTVWPVVSDSKNGLPKVRAFFNNMELKYLPALPVSSNVVELSFRNNGIEMLANEPFANFKNLQKVTLTDNHLGVIQKDFFAYRNHLTHLDLSNNSLTVITALERARFNSLQSIDLSNNNLKIVSIQLLNVLQNASVVRIEGCEIYSWDHGGELGWKVLHLGWNKLTAILAGTFSNLRQLEALYLNNNNIRVIDPQAFDDLVRLERLDISYNEITNLDANMHLPLGLQMINVAGNGMELWPFEKIPSTLRILEIQDNHLPDLSIGQSVNVLILNASSNRFESFFGGSFPELTELDLSFNALTGIPRNLGKQLVSLILDGNPIDRVFFEDEVMLRRLSLNMMPILEQLDALSFWKLVEHEDGTEHSCVEVSISNCPKLRHIDPKAFDATTLCMLDLSYNQLTSIPRDLADWNRMPGGVNLQGNPWDCSCSAKWLVDEVLPALYDREELQYLLDDFRCSSPSSRNGTRMVKYLNHVDAFCGGPRMERLQMAGSPAAVRDSDGTVRAGFASDIICSVDDPECLHAHEGLGLVIVCSVVAFTLILCLAMVIFIVIRRKRDRRKSSTDSVWLMHQKY